MNCTSLHFLYRRQEPSCYFLANSAGTQELQNSFIQRSPTHRTGLKNLHTNLLIPYQIESPTCLQKQIGFFPITFSTIRKRPKKYVCLELSQPNCSQRKCGNPNRNHMTPYCLCCCRRCNNAICPKISSPSNQSITQQVSPKNTSNSQNTQRHCHCQRNSRSPYFRFTSIIRSIEDCKKNAETICTGLTCNSHQNLMCISCCRTRCCPRKFQNSIFTIISCQERPTQQTLTSLQQTSPSQRQRSMSSSRSTHVLHICTCMNNNTSSLKQQCFKTSMSHLVIHSQSIMTQRQSNNHITQLTTCTISNDTFHIILNQPHCPPHQTRDSTNPQQYSTCINTTFPNPICTCNKENSGSYQRSSMNLSRYGSRTLHGISQPNMQTNLSTFSQSSAQLCKTNPVSIICRSPCCCEKRSICTSQIPPTKKQTQKQYSIAYTIYQHCFLCCLCPTQTVKPKTNQQITANSNHFPTNHECLQIICCYLQQHRTSKLTQITLKTSKVWIILHVPQTINMHTKTHGTNCNHHCCTQCIKTLKPFNCYSMSTKPISQRNNNRRTHRPNFIKNKIAQ